MERKFFISHSSADRNFVVWLAAELIGLSVPVWYSDWEIKVGDSIVEKVDSALESMAGLVVVVSTQSLQSRWVREEVNAGLSRRLAGCNVPLFPVRIDNVELPPLIGHRKYADFSIDRTSALAELVEAMLPAASVVERIRDMKKECIPLLERLRTLSFAPVHCESPMACSEDEIRGILLGVSSLLERAVDERYSLELRKERPARLWRAAHPERFEYLVERGFRIQSNHWARLVELRTMYLHRIGYIGSTMLNRASLRELFSQSTRQTCSPEDGDPTDQRSTDASLTSENPREPTDFEQRIAWLETVFDELTSGPRGTTS